LDIIVTSVTVATGTRAWGVQVWELVKEIAGIDWSAIEDLGATDWGVFLGAVDWVLKMAQGTHGNTESNVNDIITWATTVGETSVITTDYAHVILLAAADGLDASVETHHFAGGSAVWLVEAWNTSEEGDEEISAWNLWSEGAAVFLVGLVFEVLLEEDRDDFGKGWVENVVKEEEVADWVSRLALWDELVELALVAKANEQLVDEWVTETRDLLALGVVTVGVVVQLAD